VGTTFIGNSEEFTNSAYFAHKKAVSFPIIVKERGLTAKVYGKRPDYPYYRAAWMDAGKQKQKACKKLADAKKAARDALKQIAKGKTNLPSSKEINDLRIAQVALQGVDVGLVDAVNEYTQAKQIMPRGLLADAAKAWVENNADVKRVSFRDAAAQYIRVRKKKVSERLAYEDELRMNRFCAAFAVDVLDLTKMAIEGFFEDMDHLAPKTRNHFKATLGHFFKWCVTKDFLAPGHRLNEVLGKEATNEAAPKIITPTQFQKLLCSSPVELLPYIVIAGFAGARRSEIIRLNWEYIWRVKGQIELEAHRTKTKQRRFIEMQPALKKWLRPWKRQKGAVWTGTVDQFDYAFTKLMAANGLPGHNLLRHSFASYRLAQTQNAPKVALEMGHSVDKLFANYREAVTPKAAQQWFSILPSEAENVIAARAS